MNDVQCLQQGFLSRTHHADEIGVIGLPIYGHKHLVIPPIMHINNTLHLGLYNEASDSFEYNGFTVHRRPYEGETIDAEFTEVN